MCPNECKGLWRKGSEGMEPIGPYLQLSVEFTGKKTHFCGLGVIIIIFAQVNLPFANSDI